MSSCPQVDCSSLWDSPPQLKPNPDISGIGVLVGFMATAFITWILLVFHYIVVYNPEKDGLTEESNEHTNPIDRNILKWASVKVNRPSKRWEPAVEKLVLMVSDQQMITGIGLLASGISQIFCSISAFHWQIVVYLVWYSSFTHLATLTVLRRYLRDNKPMRWWRLILMSVIVSGLCAALVPTGNGLWLPDRQENVIINGTSNIPFSYVGMPAVCFFRIRVVNDRQLSSMIISILVLVTSYTVRAIKFFQWSSTKARKWFRTIPGSKVRNFLDKLYRGMQDEPEHRWIISVPYWLILDIYIVAKALFDLAESMMWEITWLLMALLWGTLRLFSTRNLTFLQEWSDSPEVDIFEENAWGFAQCLSTTMLLLILFTLVEVYHEAVQKSKDVPKMDDNSSINEDHISTRVSQNTPSSHTHGNINDRSDSVELVVGDAVEHDLSIQAGQTADIFIPLQSLLRSDTILSLEERNIASGVPPSIHEQGSHSGSRTAAQDGTSLLGVAQVTAPHHENFYQYVWFGTLITLIFIQSLYLSVFVLAGAYGAYDSGSLLFSSQNPAKLFPYILTWITLYAPGNTVIYAACHLFPRASAHWNWRVRLATWYNSNYPRPYTLRYTRNIRNCHWLFMSAFLLSASYLLFKFPIPAFWEDMIPLGQYLTLHVAAAVLLIVVPWGIVLRKKLQRQVGRLS